MPLRNIVLDKKNNFIPEISRVYVFSDFCWFPESACSIAKVKRDTKFENFHGRVNFTRVKLLPQRWKMQLAKGTLTDSNVFFFVGHLFFLLRSMAWCHFRLPRHQICNALGTQELILSLELWQQCWKNHMPIIGGRWEQDLFWLEKFAQPFKGILWSAYFSRDACGVTWWRVWEQHLIRLVDDKNSPSSLCVCTNYTDVSLAIAWEKGIMIITSVSLPVILDFWK